MRKCGDRTIARHDLVAIGCFLAQSCFKPIDVLHLPRTVACLSRVKMIAEGTKVELSSAIEPTMVSFKSIFKCGF